MIKLTIPVPEISTQIATFTHIQIGRASSLADAASRTGTFVDLGAVVALSPTVSAYDYFDTGAIINQYHTFRLSNSNGTSGNSYSAPFRGQESGYITVDEFREYEVGVLTDFDGNDLGDRKLERYIKMSSSIVDAYTQRSFQIRQDIERHKWNQSTRRVYPYRRPINSLVSMKVFVSNQQSASFAVNDVFINKDRGYFEVTSLSTVTYSLFPALVNLGLIEPVAEITYVSGLGEVPGDVRDATAMIAAHLIAEDSLNKQGLGAMSELTVGAMTMKRRSPEPGVRFGAIPSSAAAILDGYVAVNIR